MLLAYNELRHLIETQNLIENLGSFEQINGTSVDVRLGHEFLIENTGYEVDVSLGQSVNMQSQRIASDSFLKLYIDQFILASTLEKFNLPSNISANFHMKSSLARNGLSHMMAGHCNPGWTNSTLTLELKNDTRNHVLLLRPGMVIGQMVFFKHEPVPDHRLYSKVGRYNNASSTEGSK